MTQVAVILGLLGVGLVLVIYGTIAKNKWGINLQAVSCPRCNAPLPPVRRPETLQQALWGGSTCPSCGTHVDKWGHKVEAPTESPSGQWQRYALAALLWPTSFAKRFIFYGLTVGLASFLWSLHKAPYVTWVVVVMLFVWYAGESLVVAALWQWASARGFLPWDPKGNRQPPVGG